MLRMEFAMNNAQRKIIKEALMAIAAVVFEIGADALLDQKEQKVVSR